MAVVISGPAYPGAAPSKSACCACWQESLSSELRIVSSAFKNTRPSNIFWSQVRMAVVIPGRCPAQKCLLRMLACDGTRICVMGVAARVDRLRHIVVVRVDRQPKKFCSLKNWRLSN